MTREDAAREIDNTACCFSDKRFRDSMHMAAAALRGPQLDPGTGLMPCGCGGKAFVQKHQDRETYTVQCKQCGVSTRISVVIESLKREWNKAMTGEV